MTTDGPSLNPIQTNPMGLRLAQTYGVRPPPPPAPPPLQPVETPRPAIADKAAGPVERLVAGVVPGAVDFNGDQPQPTSPATRGDTLPFYRHPADQNAAATGVRSGRLLDTEG